MIKMNLSKIILENSLKYVIYINANMIKMNLSKIFLELYDKNIEVDVVINSVLVNENVRK